MKSKPLSGLKANNFPLLLLKVEGHGNEKQVTFGVKSKQLSTFIVKGNEKQVTFWVKSKLVS